MHVPRKRYRPLDSAEERAVHATQRVELLPLDDEQSYCFSWPESPMTQWMRENAHYAALHQLIANASVGTGGGGGGAGWSGVGGHGDALHGSAFGDVSPSITTSSSTAAVAGGRRDAFAKSVGGLLSPVSLTATGGGGVAAAAPHFPSPSAAASSARRQVELPPVHTLEDAADVACAFQWTAGTRSGDADGVSVTDDVRALLQRLRCEIDAADKEGCATSIGRGGRARTASSAAGGPSPGRRGGRAADVAPTASIVISEDAPRAVPHPKAPPRPQSVTEDSIFTLSATQLADLVACGVPALCAAADEEEARRQRLQRDEEDNTEYPSTTHSDDAPKEGHMDQELQRPTSSPGVVVVVEEAALYDGDAGSSNTPRHLTGSAQVQQQQQSRNDRRQQQQQQLPARPHVPEAYRRVMEHEVAGLEWRTWTQSQRTAAALQRLLSLEAAVPFEPSGDAHRDAWRVVVYRLWLQWRQQVPRGACGREPSTGATDATSFSSAARFSSALVQFPAADGTSQPHRLPWGAPLLAGAYLYGTSNDYFICLPPTTTTTTSAAAAAAAATPGTTTTTTAAVAGSVSPPGGAPAWPAMSRRRGTYSFLRWRVELHQAMLAHSAGAEARHATDAEAMAEEGGVEEEEEERQQPPRRPSRYAKGPLGLSETLASGRVKRQSAAETSTSTGPTSTVSSTARSAPPPPPSPSLTASSPQLSTHAMLSAAQIKALVQSTVLTQPFSELQLDGEPAAVQERLACPDLRHDMDAWRVWLSKV